MWECVWVYVYLWENVCLSEWVCVCTARGPLLLWCVWGMYRSSLSAHLFLLQLIWSPQPPHTHCPATGRLLRAAHSLDFSVLVDRNKEQSSVCVKHSLFCFSTHNIYWALGRGGQYFILLNDLYLVLCVSVSLCSCLSVCVSVFVYLCVSVCVRLHLCVSSHRSGFRLLPSSSMLWILKGWFCLWIHSLSHILVLNTGTLLSVLWYLYSGHSTVSV